MMGRTSSILALLSLVMSFLGVLGQESVDVREGVNIPLHAFMALLMCFGILGSCTVATNLIMKYCNKKMSD